VILEIALKLIFLKPAMRNCREKESKDTEN
jgi:hypothetical protein